MAEGDELYSQKTAFWLGNYEVRQENDRPRLSATTKRPRPVYLSLPTPRNPSQESIQEARAARVKTEALKIERDVYLYRAMLAAGQGAAVVDAIKDDAGTPVPLQAVKLLAVFLSAPPRSKAREVALLQLDDWLADGSASANPWLQLVSGTMYMHTGDNNAALAAIKGGGSSLETCVGGGQGGWLWAMGREGESGGGSALSPWAGQSCAPQARQWQGGRPCRPPFQAGCRQKEPTPPFHPLPPLAAPQARARSSALPQDRPA